MLATAKGYYNGSKIVLNTPVDFERGQEVLITYTILHSTNQKASPSDEVECLIGAIPDSTKTLADYRAERLEKYAHID
jgi:hypothetical protein